jgi:hypothetical protein
MASASGTRKGTMWATDLLQQGENRTLGELGMGYGTAQGFLGQAGDVWKGMAALGRGGVDRYNALAGGAGSAEELAALKASPDFQFASELGNQGLLRARAAQGMLASGNTDIDAMNYNQGLAAQQLGAARQAQIPLMNLYSQGTAGQAGTLGAQAALATDHWGNRASVIDNTNKSIAGMGLEAFKAGDAAKNQNQANMINVGMGLGKLALGGLTGGLGGGFTSLFGGGGLTPGTGGLY